MTFACKQIHTCWNSRGCDGGLGGGGNAKACLSYDMSVNFNYPIIIGTIIYYLTAVSQVTERVTKDLVSVLFHVS